eukprot:13587415-Ditylum_brightwellii.AAC.1
MVMRKYHNSMAVGFFLGAIVAMAQYSGYASDRSMMDLPSAQEGFNALLCLIESILLGTFSAILVAHRSKILTSPADESVVSGDVDESYERI